ncbi:hypothetical protein MRX96_021707 [Rhipicephalus microplus]
MKSHAPSYMQPGSIDAFRSPGRDSKQPWDPRAQVDPWVHTFPPELMARHMAFLKAAAARARAMQEAAADGEGNPQPSSFQERGQPRPAIDGARPVDFPKAIPPVPPSPGGSQHGRAEMW